MVAAMAFGLREVRVRGFRSAREVSFAPGSLCALVGEANAGKSNLLAALWALIDPGAPELRPDDATSGGDGRITIEGELDDGATTLSLEAVPPRPAAVRRDGAPPVLFFPSALRSSALVAGFPRVDGTAAEGLEVFRETLRRQAEPAWEPQSETVPARSLVRAVEACCELGVQGLVLLVEEPELYLRPQAQRYLYRLLHTFSLAGNQVIYSTHAPAFLNVGRLEELALVDQDPEIGTRVLQPASLSPEEEFRIVSEFDAERSELFLAHAAILVEGRTEKLAFPFVFRALGYDVDREAISVVECGGKSNIVLFARICEATGVPFVAVHDRDAPAGRKPIVAERALNALIADVVGTDRTVELVPDFEAVAGLEGRRHKPERAWRRFASLTRSDVPEPLERAALLALAMARG
jgi:hypothetical protein